MPEQLGQLRTGQRPVQQNVKSYKPGELLFEEGTTGRELFIIEEGKVSVFKTTPEAVVELATIGKGGLIGEMSLLDNLPRSAGVKAVEPTRAMVVNQPTFQATLQSTPAWLSSIITIVVSRLRDANKRIDISVLRDKERGVVSLMLLLLPSYRHEFASSASLDYNLVCVEAFYVCRLKKKEIIRVLEQCSVRKILTIEEDSAHTKHICFKDLEVLRLFEEFLALKSQKKTFRETSIPDESIAMLSNIAYVAQKSGQETEDGTVLSKAALIEDLQNKNMDHLEHTLLDLRRRSLINLMPADNDDTDIVFRKEIISRIKKIKEWLPQFEATPAVAGSK